jgi:hypothetical protein
MISKSCPVFPPPNLQENVKSHIKQSWEDIWAKGAANLHIDFVIELRRIFARFAPQWCNAIARSPALARLMADLVESAVASNPVSAMATADTAMSLLQTHAVPASLLLDAGQSHAGRHSRAAGAATESQPCAPSEPLSEQYARAVDAEAQVAGAVPVLVCQTHPRTAAEAGAYLRSLLDATTCSSADACSATSSRDSRRIGLAIRPELIVLPEDFAARQAPAPMLLDRNLFLRTVCDVAREYGVYISTHTDCSFFLFFRGCLISLASNSRLSCVLLSHLSCISLAISTFPAVPGSMIEQEIAATSDSAVAVPTPTQQHSSSSSSSSSRRRFITSALIDDQGAVRIRYRKQRLTRSGGGGSGGTQSLLSAGDASSAVDCGSRLGRVSLLICLDVDHADVVAATLRLAPTLIVNPAFICGAPLSSSSSSSSSASNAASNAASAPSSSEIFANTLPAYSMASSTWRGAQQTKAYQLEYLAVQNAVDFVR